jgi:pathogenesis-related protein 1
MSGWNENKFRRLLANCNNQQSGSGRQGDFNQNSSNQNVPVATHPSDSVNLNANEIKQLLNVHNQVRAEVGVSALAWSPSLAHYAQNWSNHLSSTICNLQHRQPNQYGENIFMGTQGAYQAKDAVFSWAAEKKDYHGGVLTQSNWHPAGHYTQVVWRNTQQVGCGKSLCGGNMILVCNYQPAGNMMGQKPY